MSLPAPDPIPAPGNLFPLIPQYSYGEVMEFNTLIADFESGKEQRFAKWSQPKMRFNIDLGVMDEDDANTLMDFFEARQGPAESFLFENLNERAVTAESLGQASVGGALTATLDRTQIRKSSVTITANGDTATDDGSGNLTGDFTGTINYVTGAVSITGATGNAAVTAAYRFYRLVRFQENSLSRGMFAFKLFQTRLTLVEVL